MLDKGLRVLVCGGRDYTDWGSLFKYLDTVGITTLIQGDASGADSLAKAWAVRNKIAIESYPADWNTYGKAAGAIRNKQMLVEGKPDLVIAFPGGKGTKNMVKQSNDYGVEVIQICE